MGDSFLAWKQHFIKQAKGLVPHQDSFYNVTTERNAGNGDTSSNIKTTLVSPVQQMVERAKSDVIEGSAIYDPVTGVMRHSGRKVRRVRRSGKKKSSSKKKKVVKRGRVTKKKTKSKKGKGKGKKKTSSKKKRY